MRRSEELMIKGSFRRQTSLPIRPRSRADSRHGINLMGMCRRVITRNCQIARFVLRKRLSFLEVDLPINPQFLQAYSSPLFRMFFKSLLAPCRQFRQPVSV